MKTKLILVLMAGFFFSQNSFADSPLTSTNISKAYADIRIVRSASKTEGKLTIDLMDYLYEKENPIEFKIAVINEVGWDIKGKNNSVVFYGYLKEKMMFKNKNEFFKTASGEIFICMAYLKALDNYSDVEEAIIYARKAKSKNTTSYTINIICALIESQKALFSEGGDVSKIMNAVLTDRSLNRDMRQAAVDIIFEYMGMYMGEGGE